MRRNVSGTIGLSISMIVFGLASIDSARAASKNEEVINTLKEAHKILAHADHDYDGHRAKAVDEVKSALKELGYRHKKTETTATGTTTVAKLHESQSDSDAQMRQALQILQGALSQVNGKHPKAIENVKSAITEINTALSLK